MTDKELIRALRCAVVETGSLLCLGCGYEHNCSIHGCAIIRTAVERLEELSDPPNNPLTLEQLRGMDGEPVWVRNHCSGACICRVIVSSDENFTHFSDGSLRENRSYEAYWTAYRIEEAWAELERRIQKCLT